MKEFQNAIIWQAKPVFEKMFANATNGKLRYAAKKNLRMLEPLFGDIIEWINGDKEEHEWEPLANGFPDTSDDFYKRFESFLINEKVQYEPYIFSEELMQTMDGLTGLDEMLISFVFAENQEEEEEEEV
jgi:hypothetical protein